MSAAPEHRIDPTRFTLAQEQLRRLLEEAAELAVLDLPPAEFYREFLKRVLQAVAAPAGSVWCRTADGAFLLQCRLNPGQLSAELLERGGPSRDESLRQTIQQLRPVYLPPNNPTESEAPASPPLGAVLLAPIVHRKQVEAVLEVWLGGERDEQAAPAVLQFLVRLADLATVYLVQRRRQEEDSQQERWTQLDAFTQRIHASLNPTEVACRIANEGRQLIGGDRLSVAVRHGRRLHIESVSGVESVDVRSNLIRRLRQLCESVLLWGERLVYRGEVDESLPPDVLRDLDSYLEESHAKFLVVQPVADAREAPHQQAARSVLALECFAVAVPPEQLTARLEVIARHAAPALYNASTYRQVPLRFLWQPVARIQAGLGGKTKAILAGVSATVLLLLGLLLFVPYPLKLEARGQLLPEQRRWLYAPVEGQVVRFAEGLRPGSQVVPDQSLILLYDIQLETRLEQLTREIAAAQQEAEALGKQLGAAATEKERLALSGEKVQKEALRERKARELRALRERTHAEESRPGFFWLKAPMGGTILSWDFRETLTNRLVKPSEPLLRIGEKSRRWEVELKIPQKHMGQVVQALERQQLADELDVDLLLVSAPTRTYRGKLVRGKLAGEAGLNAQDPTETESVVLASVRIDGPGIAPEDRIPAELLVSGTEIHAKVRCGDHAMGYSFFYGVWEFIYEKVVFFF